MSIIVQKYGGSSVADIEKLKKIARIIASVKQQGHDVVTVVSAMGKTTNQLIEMAKSLSPNPERRELDMLLSTGERITMALLCIALNDLGIRAISLTGSQAGIITNDRYNDASVIEVRPFRVQDELAKGQVVVIGGFQGVSYKRDITTLGRGGSDTSAVALAAALNAERCEIYSDVDGVYTADPNLIKDAKHLTEISYEQIQEMAEAGAKVLNAQAVQFAKKAKIAIYARSTFDSVRETIVREMAPTGKLEIIGVVQENEIAKITFIKKDIRNHLKDFFTLLDEKNIAVKELHYNQNHSFESENILFVISKKNIHNWNEVKKELQTNYKKDILIDETLGAVSIIGEGFSRDNKTIIETLDLLNLNKIKFFGLTTTSFRLSLLVKTDKLTDVVELLHNYWIK